MSTELKAPPVHLDDVTVAGEFRDSCTVVERQPGVYIPLPDRQRSARIMQGDLTPFESEPCRQIRDARVEAMGP